MGSGSRRTIKLLQKVTLPENEQLPERESSTYENTPVIPLDSDEPLDRAEDALEPDDTIKFEPYPMLPATLPAALLAGSIQEGKQHTEEVEN